MPNVPGRLLIPHHTSDPLASLLPVTVIFVPVQKVNLSASSVFLQHPGKGQDLAFPVTHFPFPPTTKDGLQGQADLKTY